MSGSTTAGPAVPEGYVSAEAKRRFTITAGILGAVFFVGQFVVPMMAMFALMPTMLVRSMDFEQADVGRGTVWQGRFWYLSRPMPTGPQPMPMARGAQGPTLRAVVPGSDKATPEQWEVPVDAAWLAPVEDRLWLIAEGESLYSFADGEFAEHPSAGPLGAVSRPFTYQDRLTVVEHRPAVRILRQLVDGRWQTIRRFGLGLPDPGGVEPDGVQVVAVGEGFHVFLESGGTLYYRRGLPAEGETVEPESWEPIRPAAGIWAAVELEGRPAVFSRARAEPGAKIVGLRLEDGQWREFFSHPGGLADRIGVHPTEGGDFLLSLALGPFGGRLLEVSEGEVVARTRVGRSFFPFSGGFMGVMFVPHVVTMLAPLLLAVILSSLMRRYRVARHEAEGVEGSEAEYAPLWRRGLAQMIDGSILAGPFFAGFAAMMFMFMDFEAMFESGSGFPVVRLILPHLCICLGIPWALVWLLIYSGLEGRAGQTPGKWALGIRVLGTNLLPCGFGRAFVRNILKFVDGFFNFMVGVLLAALTQNWQRLGDLAARTVVVMVRPREPTRPPESRPQGPPW